MFVAVIGTVTVAVGVGVSVTIVTVGVFVAVNDGVRVISFGWSVLVGVIDAPAAFSFMGSLSFDRTIAMITPAAISRSAAIARNNFFPIFQALLSDSLSVLYHSNSSICSKNTYMRTWRMMGHP